jgi:aromatic-amino-acid transaminase
VSLSILQAQPADPLLALIEEVRLDPRPLKIDLSVGVYRDEQADTRVLDTVKEAERRLLDTQSSKSYLGPEGDMGFVSLLTPLIFGRPPTAVVGGLQTPGGTGALRVAAELLALDRSGRRVWLGLPAWANHIPVLRAAGLDVRTFPQFDMEAQAFRLQNVLDALAEARPGDAVVLQACCHNPTGIDPHPADWRALAEYMAERKLLPLIDMAYHGLGDGLEQDAAMLRHFVQRLPECLVAYSCDKNFALYRDRVGALFVTSRTAAELERVLSNARAVARANYSMPPDHGAATVRIVLSDPALTSAWEQELAVMRRRIVSVRQAIAKRGRADALDLSVIAKQRGMFSMLPLSPGQIERMRVDHAVYMAPNGRVNLAGLPLRQVDHFVGALEAVIGLVPA